LGSSSDECRRIGATVKTSLLAAYQALPPSLQSVAASARGLYLRRWRYSRRTDRDVEAILERDTWNAHQWRAWREERLAAVLDRAATRVPYYRDQWQARRRRGDRAAWDVLPNWPILEKAPLRQNAHAFVADDRRPRSMFHEHTSGTTGTPLDLWWSRETVLAWYALFEARWRRWYGVTRRDRWAIIGGQLVTPVLRTRPPFWVWNAALRQLYLSAYHVAPASVPQYLHAMQRYGVRYIFAYPSALYALARAADPALARSLGLVVMIANAEPVLAHQREVIEETFGCPLRETYGMSEIVTAASECASRQLHLWADAGVLEVIQGGEPVPPGSTGDLVGTGLVNMDMPLIRYRVGDRGAVAADDRCACGRGLPVLLAVEGRIDDVLYTRDGRAIGRMDPVFKSQSPILEAQIIQESLDAVRLVLVPGPGYSDADGGVLARRIRERLGDVVVVVERAASIPRTANGKLRAVVCAIPKDQRPSIDAGAGQG